jgi:formylglycine-generating enzyme
MVRPLLPYAAHMLTLIASSTAHAQAPGLDAGGPLKHSWRSIEGLHWQVLDGTLEVLGTEPHREAASCPSDMREIHGDFKVDSFGQLMSMELEELQNSTCLQWLKVQPYPARCLRFDEAKWRAIVARYATKPMHFCMDTFEYPNLEGQNPIIVTTFPEAEALCKAQGRRLCSEAEWTFACEGEEALPYPIGFVRDSEACVADRPYLSFADGAFYNRASDGARAELDRLWQGEPSGSHPKCVSVFGVHDMVGNVDEWTTSVQKSGYKSIMKGGYWGPVRTRCRPATRGHDEGFVAYQQGFRCCSSATAPSAQDEPRAMLNAPCEPLEGPNFSSCARATLAPQPPQPPLAEPMLEASACMSVGGSSRSTPVLLMLVLLVRRRKTSNPTRA